VTAVTIEGTPANTGGAVLVNQKVTPTGINVAHQERKTPTMRTARILAALLSSVALFAPLAALAQQSEPAPAAPTYARPAANGEETIHGRVDRLSGKYGLQVHDDRGFIDNVELHQGTIINPTGLSLQPGMAVTIEGFNRGRVFAANEIDTPYGNYGLVPGGYPYPVSIGIGFGPVYYHHWH
jgi:hypothetical protein